MARRLAFRGDGKIDGVALAAGDRVLVKDQNDPQENDIYEVQAGSPLSLARPVMETIEAGDAVLVSERHTNSERWALGANDNPIKVGITRLPWGRRDPFFNILDFGADPTGKADSWQAFKDWRDLIFKGNASKGSPRGWVCTKGWPARASVDPAEFTPMPNL